MTDEVKNGNETPAEAAPPAEAAAGNGQPAAEVDDRDRDLELEKARVEAQINLTGWQRERADFANYKRRTDKEMKEARERGSLEAITKMLPILDDFERALTNIPPELQSHPWVSGTALILKKFDKVLDEFAVEVIDPVGQPFDPHRHEAIGTDASTDEIASGHVTVTLQKGYASGERVLRPALVRVAG
ncbi:MAG: nucleotide exchange factor GrpE [Anaerolineae bacterium]|jgi:molecular chaperone GrpE|nr:nucleotide exchange factor GrpE [Anaerolineae bacterium]